MTDASAVPSVTHAQLLPKVPAHGREEVPSLEQSASETAYDDMLWTLSTAHDSFPDDPAQQLYDRWAPNKHFHRDFQSRLLSYQEKLERLQKAAAGAKTPPSGKSARRGLMRGCHALRLHRGRCIGAALFAGPPPVALTQSELSSMIGNLQLPDDDPMHELLKALQTRLVGTTQAGPSGSAESAPPAAQSKASPLSGCEGYLLRQYDRANEYSFHAEVPFQVAVAGPSWMRHQVVRKPDTKEQQHKSPVQLGLHRPAPRPGASRSPDSKLGRVMLHPCTAGVTRPVHFTTEGPCRLRGHAPRLTRLNGALTAAARAAAAGDAAPEVHMPTSTYRSSADLHADVSASAGESCVRYPGILGSSAQVGDMVSVPQDSSVSPSACALDLVSVRKSVLKARESSRRNARSGRSGASGASPSETCALADYRPLVRGTLGLSWGEASMHRGGTGAMSSIIESRPQAAAGEALLCREDERRLRSMLNMGLPVVADQLNLVDPSELVARE